MNSSLTKGVRQTREWDQPTPEQFRAEILPGKRPAVMRQIARDWPLVTAARKDPHLAMELLSKRATATEAEVLRADPAEGGRFHYTSDGRALNFIRGRGNIPGLIAGLRQQEQVERPFALAAQGLVAERFLQGFAIAHPMPLVPGSAEPRLWIGNAAKVATHNDPVDNVAVVAVGHRRFTLFPPDQQPNLYMGPEHPTPAGTPVSMVHVTSPDLAAFPRFARALEAAQDAELSPGDAIFIPRDWYHHVEALDRFNVLVNYWWDADVGGA
ncbi:cupin-like domain-containing protein [Sphingomonas sp.]|uniref:cupin-like domain-containing protein n=1 Tax=Sphingomonas sp. TaxID=28214 RepID=UPI0025F9B44A|nr:cupin-like domain-containing protein [Sphingomonas sp.]MBV9528976.1 cupin-like domain-containing protein [Sphingomonas sp.]